MSDKRYVARSTAIAARVLGNETMVMSAANSTLFTLDEVATVIWESADGTTPLDEIVANKVCAQYDIAPEIALKDAEGLVQELAEHGLLLLSDKPIGQSAAAPARSPRRERRSPPRPACGAAPRAPSAGPSRSGALRAHAAGSRAA